MQLGLMRCSRAAVGEWGGGWAPPSCSGWPAALLLSPPATGGTGGCERVQREPGLCAALRAALETDCASVITALLLHSLATPNYMQG